MPPQITATTTSGQTAALRNVPLPSESRAGVVIWKLSPRLTSKAPPP